MLIAAPSAPPATKIYIYDSNVNTREQFNGIIGRCAFNDTNPQLTPEQKKRQIVITICALTVIAAVALIVAAYAIPMIPLLNVTVPLLIIGLGVSLLHQAIRELNLNSPEDRKKIRSALCKLPFDKMIEKHASQILIDYDLLKAIPIRKGEENQLYQAVLDIEAAYNKVKKEYQDDLLETDRLYLEADVDQQQKGKRKVWEDWRRKEYQNITTGFKNAIDRLNRYYDGTVSCRSPTVS